MPETQARIGYGAVVEFAPIETPTAYEYVAEAKNFTLPSATTDQQDVTHMQSPGKSREFIDGLTDEGELGFTVNHVPGSRTDLLLIAAKGKRKRVRVTFPNGVQILFSGSRQSYERSAETESAMEATVSLKVSGQPVQTPITAPRNLEAPVLRSDTTPPQVGGVIEIDTGIWGGALDIDVQWQADGEDIEGADGLAYVPTAEDAGAVITAVVTGSNSEYDTPITTVALAAVVDPSAEE